MNYSAKSLTDLLALVTERIDAGRPITLPENPTRAQLIDLLKRDDDAQIADGVDLDDEIPFADDLDEDDGLDDDDDLEGDDLDDEGDDIAEDDAPGEDVEDAPPPPAVTEPALPPVVDAPPPAQSDPDPIIKQPVHDTVIVSGEIYALLSAVLTSDSRWADLSGFPAATVQEAQAQGFVETDGAGHSYVTDEGVSAWQSAKVS